MASEKRLIDATDFIKTFWQRVHDGEIVTLMDVEHAIINAPTVDAMEVVHGEWKVSRDSEISRSVYCSACGKGFYYAKKGALNIDKMPYCPNCGVKMDQKGE